MVAGTRKRGEKYMREKRKPAHGGNRERAGRETACEARSSSINSTTSPVERQIKISDFLHHGQENAVPTKYLKEILHVDARTIRLLVQEERLNGIPILSDSSGYFLPGNSLEVLKCVRSLRHRAKEITRAAAGIERGGASGG